jgi:hypothetical protein
MRQNLHGEFAKGPELRSNMLIRGIQFGGRTRTRTLDPVIKSQLAAMVCCAFPHSH